MRLLSKISGLAATLLMTLTGFAASAQVNVEGFEGLEIHRPENGAYGFQAAATELARDLQSLDWLILVIISAIVVFVTALILYIIVRFNRRANKTPASFTHNSPLEVAWTLIPILILIFIGAFSLPVLFKQQEIPEADITIKVTGYQWYWGYEYVDEDIEFLSYMIGQPATLDSSLDADATPYVLDDAMTARLERSGYERSDWLLAVDNAVVVPLGATVVMQVTAADVIHSWAIPAFGVKQDGVPGRLAELWFEAEVEGVFYGQCSELCGRDHSYMPIAVMVVSPDEYEAWLAREREDLAALDAPQTVVVASND